MNKQSDRCEIIADAKNIIASWVFSSLGEPMQGLNENTTIGIMYQGKIIAGIVFNDLTPERNVWLSIFSIDRRWCCRRIIKFVFNLAFNIMKVYRVSVMIDDENIQSKNLVQRLGFKEEGRLRGYESNGNDCVIYGLLKSENRWG